MLQDLSRGWLALIQGVFRIVADEEADFGGAQVAFVEFHVVVPVEVQAAKGDVEEFLDGVVSSVART